MVQPFLDLRGDAVAGLEHPFIEPQPESGLPKPLCQQAYDRFVLCAMAEENVVFERAIHCILRLAK